MKFIHAAPFYYYFSPRFILRAFSRGELQPASACPRLFKPWALEKQPFPREISRLWKRSR